MHFSQKMILHRSKGFDMQGGINVFNAREKFFVIIQITITPKATNNVNFCQACRKIAAHLFFYLSWSLKPCLFPPRFCIKRTKLTIQFTKIGWINKQGRGKVDDITNNFMPSKISKFTNGLNLMRSFRIKKLKSLFLRKPSFF